MYNVRLDFTHRSKCYHLSVQLPELPKPSLFMESRGVSLKTKGLGTLLLDSCIYAFDVVPRYTERERAIEFMLEDWTEAG
jgi:hypothetical protein